MSLSLGQSKKVQDIQKKLDMSLDDLIKTKRVAPKAGSAGAAAKGKKAPKSLVSTRPAAAKRNAQATGIAAKKLDMKAKRAAGAALRGIAGRRAPLGVATRGVGKGKGSTAKATGTVVKRSGGVQTTLAKRIVSRARATVKQQPQLRGRQAPKTVPTKKAKAKIPAPKFLGNAGTAPKQQQAPRQAQRKQASTAGRIGQQRQQQQLQQGRRAPKTLVQQPPQQQRQNGRNLNQTIGGGVRKAAKQPVPKFQARIASQQQQQQGARQQRRGQQARAPVYVQQQAPQQQGSRGQRRQQQQQQQYQQFPQQQQGGRGGRNRAPLSVGQQGAHAFAAPAHPGLPALPMPFPMGFYNPATGQYAAAPQPQQYTAAAQQAPSMPAGQMYMDTNTGMQYWVPASEKNPSAYVQRLLQGEATNTWAATQTALRSVKQQRPAIARRGRS